MYNPRQTKCSTLQPDSCRCTKVLQNMNGFISSEKQTNLKISKVKAVTNTNVIFSQVWSSFSTSKWQHLDAWMNTKKQKCSKILIIKKACIFISACVLSSTENNTFPSVQCSLILFFHKASSDPLLAQIILPLYVKDDWHFSWADVHEILWVCYSPTWTFSAMFHETRTEIVFLCFSLHADCSHWSILLFSGST